MAVRELDTPPAMLPLYARAGAAMIPGGSRLPVIGGLVGGGGGDVPDLTLTLRDAAIDRQRLAAYDEVCGFRLRDVLPPTFPHILAFPLQLSLMTDPGFPFPAIGLVHIANRITQHRPIQASETLQIKVWATPLEDHPRGKQFSLRSEARVGDELVWEEVSTNLKRGSGAEGAATPGSDLPRAKDLPATATWKLPGDLGRRYARVSGDMNPIHMHPLSARLFGFQSAIAHGMWTKARCLAALQAQLSDRFTVEAVFKRPILLPGTVEFCERAAGDGVEFGVRDAGNRKSHLDGRVAPI